MSDGYSTLHCVWARLVGCACVQRKLDLYLHFPSGSFNYFLCTQCRIKQLGINSVEFIKIVRKEPLQHFGLYARSGNKHTSNNSAERSEILPNELKYLCHRVVLNELILVRNELKIGRQKIIPRYIIVE